MQTQTMIYAYPDLSACGTCSTQLLDGNGWFLSAIFDSGHEGMQWDRLHVEGNMEHIRLDVWISNQRSALDAITDSYSPIKATITSSYPHVLLHQARGRYLRFLLQIQPTQTTSVITGYELAFPYRSCIELLPQMYQNHDDLHLFIAPLEDCFQELQKQIREMPAMWNPEVADDKQLYDILHFLKLERFQQEDGETIRQLLLHYRQWMKQRGTFSSLSFLATQLLKRNVLLRVKGSCIHLYAAYDNDNVCIHVADLLSQEVPLGTTLHITWLMDSRLNNSYTDIGLTLDQASMTTLEKANEGAILWI